MTEISNSIGKINDNYVLEYDKDCENYGNFEDKYIIKVKSSSIDDIIWLFKEPNFRTTLKKAFNYFIICIDVDVNDVQKEDEENEAIRFVHVDSDRLILLQINNKQWLKKPLHRTFINLNDPQCKNYKDLLVSINCGNILDLELKLEDAVNQIKPEIDDFVVKLLKLLKYDSQKDADRILLETALEQKCLFNIIETMNTFHTKTDSERMNKYEIDALIFSKSNSIGVDNLEDYKLNLEKEDKEMTTDEIAKLHGNPNALLQHLCSRSRIAVKNEKTEKERMEKIENYYRRIINVSREHKEYEALEDLLKLVDHILLIVFDFDSYSIHRSYLMKSKNSHGIFDPDRMTIILGVKNDNDVSSREYEIREWDIMGTLIHEITHYANYKVFRNGSKPFRLKNDEENMKLFQSIVDEYKDLKDHDKIVRDVFEYFVNFWAAELIVRVPQMIIAYIKINAERLKNLSEIKYCKLFKYFFNILIPAIKAYLDPDNQLKRKINRMSLFKIEDFKIKPIKKTIEYDTRKYVHYAETNIPELMLANFYQNFNDDFAIFTSMTELVREETGEEILSLWSSDYRIKIVVLCDAFVKKSVNFEKVIKKFDDHERLNQIFIIFESKSRSKDEIRKMMTSFTKIEDIETKEFLFYDLDDESKKTIMNKKVSFQGVEMPLNKIVSNDTILNSSLFPLKHYIESNDLITIGAPIELNPDYNENLFVDRMLLENNKIIYNTKSSDRNLLLSNHKFIVLSDEAGKGKSTLMTHLALSFFKNINNDTKNQCFVIKINLHQHVDALKKFNDAIELNTFLYENFIKTSQFETFERAVFEESFQQSQIILMLDGFDEISPTCEEQTIKIIEKALTFGTSNVIVASRPSFAQKITSNASKVQLNLMPFTIENQVDFLVKYFKSHEKLSKNLKECEISEISNKFLFEILTSVSENFNELGYHDHMFSFPLHLRMFADVILNKMSENSYENLEDALNSIASLNLYDLYDGFFKIKKEIAGKEKGTVVKEEITSYEFDVFSELDLIKCGQKLALNVLHSEYKTNPIHIEEDEKKFLERYGIVTNKHDGTHFIHRSYAEFLIAKLFLQHLAKGTLQSSDFTKNHFLIDTLTLVEYENIKAFIDKALSNDKIYSRISNLSFKCFGKFILKEYEDMIGNDKNFLHCVIEHEKIYRIRRGTRRDFIFISHFMIESLKFCNEEKDKEIIRNILMKPWDINDFPEDRKTTQQYMYTMDLGENIFHLVCRLCIKCLVIVVWDLAENVFDDKGKDYFLLRGTNSRFEQNVFKNALQMNTIVPVTKSKQNYLSFEELIKKRHKTNDSDEVNVNFDLSIPSFLLKIATKLKLSETQFNSIIPLEREFELTNSLTDGENIIFLLNFYWEYLSNNFPLDQPQNSEFVMHKICFIVTYALINDALELVKLNVMEVIDFLKEKTGTEYKKYIQHIFGLSFQSGKYPPFGSFAQTITEDMAKALYLELKGTFDEDLNNLNEYFKHHPHFFDCYVNNGVGYNAKAFRKDLFMYFKILDDDHLTSLLLNQSLDSFNILVQVVIKFQNECLKYLLNLLENRFIDKEKLYLIVEESQMLNYSTVSIANFPTVFEFCEKNFEKTKIESLLFTTTHGLKTSLRNIHACTTITNFFNESFSIDKWKLLFFQINSDDETIIHEMLLTGFNESAIRLMQIAKEKLSKFDFKRLINVKDKNGNTILFLKEQNNLHEMDTSINFCIIL